MCGNDSEVVYIASEFPGKLRGFRHTDRVPGNTFGVASSHFSGTRRFVVFWELLVICLCYISSIIQLTCYSGSKVQDYLIVDSIQT